MNAWVLPQSVKFGEEEYLLNTDFRDILEIIGYLVDETQTEFVRWQIAIGLFYEQEIPQEYQQEAMQYLADFISYGVTENKPGPKLIDWEQDANLIVSDINKVAGCEIRLLKYLHWWTFLSYFYAIGEGQLSTVVSIRKKRATGKKMEKWEQEFYRANKNTVEFTKAKSDEAKNEKENIMKWL